MRVERQDGWAGQSGTGRGVPLHRPGLGPTLEAAHWTSGTRSRRLYLSAQGHPSKRPWPHTHWALPAPFGQGEIPAPPLPHESRDGSTPTPRRPRPRPVSTPKAALSPIEFGRGQTSGSAPRQFHPCPALRRKEVKSTVLVSRTSARAPGEAEPFEFGGSRSS